MEKEYGHSLRIVFHFQFSIFHSMFTILPPSSLLFSMDNPDVQKKCEEFLQSLGVPGFLVFGWKKGSDEEGKKAEFGVVSSYHQMPKDAALKGMTWALQDFVQRSF